MNRKQTNSRALLGLSIWPSYCKKITVELSVVVVVASCLAGYENDLFIFLPTDMICYKYKYFKKLKSDEQGDKRAACISKEPSKDSFSLAYLLTYTLSLRESQIQRDLKSHIYSW